MIKMNMLMLMILPTLSLTQVYSQDNSLIIAGTLEFSNSNDATPEPGTLRWTGSDFEGWTGEAWFSLTLHTKVGSVIDIDSNEYRTVFIGHREWMAENLRTSRFRNGAQITLISDGNSWVGSSSSAAYCYYDNDTIHNQPYGKLYNWHAVQANEGLCPTGWAIPDQVDWKVLADALGGNSIAGGKMKEKGTEYWASPNLDATNSSGYNGLPAGRRISTSGSFFGKTNAGYYWSRDAFDATRAYYHILWHSLATLSGTSIDKRSGLSIRCVRE